MNFSSFKAGTKNNANFDAASSKRANFDEVQCTVISRPFGSASIPYVVLHNTIGLLSNSFLLYIVSYGYDAIAV